MAVVTHDLLKRLYTQFKSDFKEGLKNAKSIYKEIAMTVKSNSDSNTYGWMGDLPDLREWVGDRQHRDLSSVAYQITNKRYEGSVSVPVVAIEDDCLNVYAHILRKLGDQTERFIGKNIFGLLKNGFENLCFDGKPFFSKEHPVGTKKVSNMDITGSTAGTPWFLLNTDSPIKPLIYQEREAAELTGMTSPQDEAVYMRGELRYGVKCRFNAGYGLWQQAYASKKPLDQDNFNKAYTDMMSFSNSIGYSYDVIPNLLVVPPSLRSAALSIVTDRLANGADNINSGVVKVIVTPWLI